MKIWQVTTNDTQLRLYWFATKAEADRHAREYRKESIEEARQENGWKHWHVEVEAIEVEPTRAGIAEALNHVISMTCFNEG